MLRSVQKLAGHCLNCKSRPKLSDKLSLKVQKAATENAVLDGVGTETWTALWNAAKAYSLIESYPHRTFPNTDEDAHCVLCHQPLAAYARKRLQDFEAFVTSALETDVKLAENAYDNAKVTLPKIPSDDQLRTILQGMIKPNPLSSFQRFNLPLKILFMIFILKV